MRPSSVYSYSKEIRSITLFMSLGIAALLFFKFKTLILAGLFSETGLVVLLGSILAMIIALVISIHYRVVIIKYNGLQKSALVILALIGFTSCHSNQPGSQAADHKDSSKMESTSAPKPELKGLTYAYKKDPACGMPLTAGIEDTLTYKGKLYGFCSKECKAEFLKDPVSYLANAK